MGVKMALRGFPVAIHATDGMLLIIFRVLQWRAMDPQPTISSFESIPVTREACILEKFWPLAQRFGSWSFPMQSLANSALLHIGLH